MISQGLIALGLPADKAAILAQYEQMVLKGNELMNLTSITDPNDMAKLHILDCAALLNCTDIQDKTLLDIGTGAGFPGLVLKILEPSIELTLLDSTGKKLDWLQETCRELGVEGIRFIYGRAEEKAHLDLYRANYDFVTSRAVAPLNMLVELCLPFLKIGGFLLAQKAGGSDDEIKDAESAITKLGGKLLPIYSYTIPGTEIARRVVPVIKLQETESRYPRRWARIRSNPL